MASASDIKQLGGQAHKQLAAVRQLALRLQAWAEDAVWQTYKAPYQMNVARPVTHWQREKALKEYRTLHEKQGNTVPPDLATRAQWYVELNDYMKNLAETAINLLKDYRQLTAVWARMAGWLEELKLKNDELQSLNHQLRQLGGQQVQHPAVAFFDQGQLAVDEAYEALHQWLTTWKHYFPLQDITQLTPAMRAAILWQVQQQKKELTRLSKKTTSWQARWLQV